MRTDWSSGIDWDKGYITHPEIRPEEQERLVPRVADGPTIVYPKQAEPPTCIKNASETGIFDTPSVLDEAKEVIKERGENYDHPLPNHQRIAALWSVILGTEVTPLQVVQCMIAVKLARLIATPEHRDSLVDICGYAACAETIIVSERDA